MNVPPAEPAASATPAGEDQAAPRADAAERPLQVARRRARLERVFGTEPLSTRDDLPYPESTGTADDWYRENRPPHHD